MQELRSIALPTPFTDTHDYEHLQDQLLRAITPRLLTFSILTISPVIGFLHPPAPLRLSPPRHSSSSSSSTPPSLKVFFFFNALALLGCLVGLAVSVSHFFSALQNSNNRYASLTLQRKRLAQGLSKTAGVLACLAMVCVCLFAAYPFGCLTVAGDSKFFQYAVVVPSLICGLLFFEVLLFLGRHFGRWWASFMPDRHLWLAIQRHTFFGSAISSFLSLSAQAHGHAHACHNSLNSRQFYI